LANNTRKGFFSSNVSLNNNVNKFGNLIIPEEYGYFIRLNNGKIGIKINILKLIMDF